MASRLTLLEIVQTLEQTGLVPAERLDTLSRELRHKPLAAEALIRLLLERNWLTPFQAERLADGQLLLGSYVLLERLGKGGMGEVYKARHLLLDRLVALKMIRQDQEDEPDMVLRFHREIKLAACLHHPHIVQVYDADALGPTLFYIMEYLPGIDLGRLIKSAGPLPPQEACEYVCQAGLGLQEAHEKGLVHRDVKPSNLLLVAEQRVVKVLDLGLAFRPRRPDAEDASLTQSSVALGTADYMAPEQVVDAHQVDHRADIYSLGCTLYYLLTGRPPFPGGSRADKHGRHLQHEPDDVETLCPELPPHLPAVLRKMMAKNPEERYQSAAAAVKALRGHLSVETKSVGSAPTQVSWARSRPRWGAHARRIALLAAVLVGGSFLGILLSWPGEETPPLRPSLPQPERPVAREWIVSRSAAPAENVFSTVRAALDRAQPGERILVRDENHEEQLEILDGQRGRGVTVEGATRSGRPVTWRMPANSPNKTYLLDLHKVEDFCLKGFVLDGVNQLEVLVRMQGACSGTQLENVSLQRFTQAAVCLDGCLGSAMQPLRLSKLQVAQGLPSSSAVLFAGSLSREVEISGCCFTGPFQSVLELAAPVQRVRFGHNRVSKANEGVLFQSGHIDPRFRIELNVMSNTFHAINKHGLGVQALPLVEKTSKLEVTNNLFVQTAILAQTRAQGPSPTARWVVPPDGLHAGPRYFRSNFEKKTKAPDGAFWDLYCDDTFVAWWNGVKVGESEPGRRYYQFDVTEALRDNPRRFEYLAVQCNNSTGRAGLLSQVFYEANGTAKLVHWSEKHFRVSHVGNAGWQVPVQVDGTFQATKIVEVTPLRITGAIGNVRDAVSKEGNLVLNTTVMDVSSLSLNPALPGHFLRYPPTSPLAKAGFREQPVGAP